MKRILSPTRPWPRCGLALTALATPALAAAQAVEVQAVQVVASVADVEHRAAVGSKTVVTSADLARYGESSLVDALRRVPGIGVESTGGADTVLRLRGLGAGYTQILLNGDPVPPGFNIASIAPETIERIEILRTPTADLSSQAIAGTINFILKRAIHEDHRKLKLSAGADGARPVATASFQASGKRGAFSYILGAAATRDSARNTATIAQTGLAADGAPTFDWLTTQHGTELTTREDVTGEMNWTPSPADALVLTTLLRHQHYASNLAQATATPFGAPPEFSAGDLGYHQTLALARGKLVWKHTFDNDAKLSAEALGEIGRRSTNAPFVGDDASGAVIDTQSVVGRLTDSPRSATVRYNLPFGDGHDLEVGAGEQTGERRESRVQTEVVAPGYTPDDIDEAYLSLVHTTSAYAQDEWDAGKRWSFYWGARWEGVDTSTSGKTIAPVSRRFENLSPILQTAWTPWDGVDDKLRLSLARSYKPPTPRELTPRRYVAINNGPTSPDTQGNPELAPELAWNLDLSFEKTLFKSGSLDLSAFAKRIDQVIVDQLSDTAGVWMRQPVNDGPARVEGIEAELKLPLRDVIPDAPPVTMHVDAARNWSRVEDVPGPDNTLARQTPFTAHAGADFDAKGTWAFGGTLGIVGASRARVDTLETDRRGLQRELDLYALWRHGKDCSLRLSVDNALRSRDLTGVSVAADDGMQTQRTSAPTTTTIRLSLEMSL